MSSLTQNARRERIAAAARAVPEQAERRPFTWKGEQLMLPVVRVSVEDVLLNPRTHRVRAQVQSLGAAGQVLSTDPYGEEAQNILAQLIADTKGYSEVKRTIRREKQQDPGLITHEGVLINANTRAVALRELHKELPYEEGKSFEFIKVQVLPEDASTDDIMRLEFDFQMRRNVQQDYTFTNRLLFIKDLLDAGMRPEEIGLEMNRSYNANIPKERQQAAREVEAEDRLRQILEELIAASSGTLGWPDFDDDRQNLIEIDETYLSMAKTKSPDVARRVRQAKIVGLLAGVDYRRARQIDDSYLDGYVLPALEEQSILRPAAQALAIGSQQVQRSNVAGLSLLDDLEEDGGDEGTGTVTLQPLFDILLRTGKMDPAKDIDAEVEIPTAAGITTMPKSTFLDAVKLAMQTAADSKARDDQGQDALDIPRRRLSDAMNACDRTRRAYDELEQANDLPDVAALEAALEAYLRAHDELIDYLAQRGFEAARNRQ